MSKLQSVRGTRDLFGEDMRRFEAVVAPFRRLTGLYGFERIEIPVFEFTELFARGIGEATDVVAKEMYSFEDRGGESITLRPEFTAGICRAYLSGGWQQHAPLRLFTYGPVFRYERPQKGRYRQFNQIDAEIIGAAEPQADIELIAMAWALLGDIGVADKCTLLLNTLGDGPSRDAWRGALVDYFSAHKDTLSDDSRARLSRNPLRILDSKDAGDKAIVADAPLLGRFLSSEAGAFFDAVQAGLTLAGVPFTLEPKLVRGLDYYCHTAFEFVTDHLGAQGTVIGGGRYDGLMEQLGGPATPAVGWAGGLERLAMLVAEPPRRRGPIAVVPLGEAAHSAALALLQQVRGLGLAADMAFKGNMKKRLARANDAGSPAALILGDDEIAQGVVALKDLTSGTQTIVTLADLATQLAPYRV
jgi:histidyl-tRNA synthetase